MKHTIEEKDQAIEKMLKHNEAILFSIKNKVPMDIAEYIVNNDLSQEKIDAILIANKLSE